MRRLKKVDTTWCPELAYVIGIIATDGNLSPSGRHINITSKDVDLIRTVRKLLRLDNKIGKKARGGSQEKKYFVLQFGDIAFYEFLESIGLSRAKSKTMGRISIPDEFFIDFLRGCIDGDGTIGAFKHPESVRPQIRLCLTSASPRFLDFMLGSIRRLCGVKGGYIYDMPNKSASILSFGKEDSVKILRLIYYSPILPALKRKLRIAERLMGASSRIGTGARLRTVWSNP